MLISGNLCKVKNKAKHEVKKHELLFLRIEDPKPRPHVDKMGSKIKGGPGN